MTMAVLLVLAFVFIGFAIEVQQYKVFDWELSFLYWIHDHHVLPDSFFTTVTYAGDVLNIAILAFSIALYLLFRREFQDAATVILLVGGSAITNIIIKAIFNRERPELWHWLLEEAGSSFPSGHSMLSASLTISLIIIAWKTKYRWFVFCCGVGVVVLVGMSRLVIGVHYPSDILAGWCLVGIITCVVVVVNKLRITFNQPI